MALIGMLLPSAYGLMAGYQLSQLQIENQKLQTRACAPRSQGGRLLSAERLQELAKMQDFIDPAPERPCIWSRRTISRSR